MKLATFNINGIMRSGIQFSAKNQAKEETTFFYSPLPAEVFAKWTGQRWVILPPDRLSPGRKAKLIEGLRRLRTEGVPQR